MNRKPFPHPTDFVPDSACRRVAVGMSGGVDSTVAAALLQEAGFEVIGLTMLIWDPSIRIDGELRNGCFGPGEQEDLEQAQAMADKLGVAHHTIRLSEAYRREVLDTYRAEYLAGRTPNPCAICNPRMKFDLMPAQARAQGIAFDRFATGHYARIVPPSAGTGFRLLRGLDPAKDQSYFLARLSQRQLAGTLLPLGELTKTQVRAKARELGLSDIADAAESQDFFEGADHGVLFDPDQANRPGPIVDRAGNRIGTHRGIVYYTIGQRQGLGIATGQKCYVSRICARTNTLEVDTREAVMQTGCRVRDVHWIAGTPPLPGIRCHVQLRYRHPGVWCSLGGETRAQGLPVAFDEPQFAVTPGQMAVFYEDNEVLGGGWIASHDACIRTSDQDAPER